ncbi:MAG: hypothetical protein ACYC9O_12700, partial [Candidatus Latescibacterota bacterium]
ARLCKIRHSPKLVIDTLEEYDSAAGGTINVDVKSHDQMMLSWGKSGVTGDVDADDDALIDFYIIPDLQPNHGVGAADGLSDFDHNEGTAVRTAADGHKI